MKTNFPHNASRRDLAYGIGASSFGRLAKELGYGRGRGGDTVFDPTSIDSLVHRYRASQAEVEVVGGTPAAEGDPVGFIPDEVGSDDVTAPSSGARGTLAVEHGIAYVSLDGVDDIYTTGNWTGGDIATPNIWFIGRIRDSTGYFFDSTVSTADRRVVMTSILSADNTRILSNGRNNVIEAPIIEAQDWASRGCIRRPGVFNEFDGIHNGVIMDTAEGGGALAGMYIGGNYIGSQESKLDILEILVFDDDITDHLEDLQAYALATYGDLLLYDFDPANLPGVVAHYDASDESTMFSDAAGTTPAGAGDKVLVWVDRVSGAKLEAPTDSEAPVRATVSGLDGIEGDGVNDHWRSDTDYLAGALSSGYSIFAVVRAVDGTSHDVLTIGGVNMSTSLAELELVKTSGTGLGDVRLNANRATTAAVLQSAALPGTPPEGQLIDARVTGATTGDLSTEGVVRDSTVAGLGSMLPVGTHGYLWVMRSVFNEYFEGTIHEIVIADDNMSERDRFTLRMYLYNKWKAIIGA